MTVATDQLNERMDRDLGLDGPEVETGSLAVLTRAEIDMQVATARRFPRSIARAKQRMVDMATIDLATAESCTYTLKRWDSREKKDVFIEGPSVRMAEIALSCWGNSRTGARIIGEDNGFIVAQGVCHDIENNVVVSIESRRRITNREGRRYSDDMVGTTANAAASIALRNAVFRVVPKVYIDAAYNEARKLIAAGDKAVPMGLRRQRLVETFGKMHVTAEQVLKFLEKPDGAGIEDITGDDIVKLRGAYNAIQQNEQDIDDLFPPIKHEDTENGANGNGGAPKTRSEAASTFNDQLNAGRANRQRPASPATPPAPVERSELAGETPAAQPGQSVQAASGHPSNVDPQTGEVTGDADAQALPKTLPDEARGNKEWIDKVIPSFKPEGLTAHMACKAFHDADVADWSRLGLMRQQEKYEQLIEGAFPFQQQQKK